MDAPHIIYFEDGIKRRYYSDIFIPSKKLIIEVKSEFTMRLHFWKNMLKFKAVRDSGFIFKLMVLS